MSGPTFIGFQLNLQAVNWPSGDSNSQHPTRDLTCEWIMMSPLSVTALAMHKVAGAGWNLTGDWEPAVQASADLLAAMLWGFALWWIAAAAIVTSHAGRGAFRFSPSSWSYVFPPAAMTLATLTLGRHWNSGFMEIMAVAFALLLLAITAAVVAGSIRAIRQDRKQQNLATATHEDTTN